MEQSILLQESATIADLANRAVLAIIDGEIDPITAHINISRMEAAIKAVKDNPEVKDITLRELAKYGKKHAFGDCVLEEAEAGVKYDYSMCGDSELAELESMRFEIDTKIKARQTFLKHIPTSGIADPHTGEVVYPPARSSKTIIKTTFNKR